MPEHLGIHARTLTNTYPCGPCRQTGLGIGSTMARVGSIISPLVSMTSELFPSMPLFIYGTVPVAASAFTALLPETLGQPLPDTVQDLENRWAPTQRGARTYPRSHIQVGVALRLKPRPLLPGQGSLSLFPWLAESPRVPPGPQLQGGVAGHSSVESSREPPAPSPGLEAAYLRHQSPAPQEEREIEATAERAAEADGPTPGLSTREEWTLSRSHMEP